MGSTIRHRQAVGWWALSCWWLWLRQKYEIYRGSESETWESESIASTMLACKMQL
jgi:hypothetical protein